MGFEPIIERATVGNYNEAKLNALPHRNMCLKQV